MEIFGQMPDGQPVHRIAIAGGGLSANFLTYGAVLQDLKLEGHDASLVLGFETFEPYLTRSPYFGATAGRCANRIRDGHLELDQKVFQLDKNFLSKHSLHGGTKSMGKRVWRLVDHAKNMVRFALTLQNGEMGYPGEMEAIARFELGNNGTLDIQYEATTDTTTLCNFAHHSYFNLSGETNILSHELSVAADSYLPVDEELIPIGEIRDVSDTVFDFRTPKTVSSAAAYQLLDHNFCTAKRRLPLRDVAFLTSPKSGVGMRCLTTEPGLQVYDGAKISLDIPGLENFAMGPHAGIALEPQIWPDASHHAHFPSAVLRPDETYSQHTQYIFSKETS